MFDKEVLDFHQMFDNAAHGVIVRKAYPNCENIEEFRIVYCNKFFKKYFGLSYDDYYGKGIKDIFSNDSERYMVLQAFTKIIKTGQSLLNNAYSSVLNKHLKIFSFSPNQGFVVSIYEDLTPQKQLEHYLQGTDNQTLQLADCLDEAFWVRKGDLVIYVNPAYEKITGLPCRLFYEDLYSILKVVYSEDYKRVSNTLINDGANEDANYNIEFRIMTPSGSIRWVWLRTFIIRDFHQKTQNKAGSLIDITDRKLLNEELTKNHKQISTLFDLFKKSSQHMELDTILSTTQKMLHDQLHIQKMAFYLYEDDSKSLRLRSSLNLRDNFYHQGAAISLEGNRFKHFLNEKKIISWQPDEFTSQQVQAFFACHKIQSVITFPFVHSDQVLGILNLYLEDKDSLKQAEQELILAICNQLAVLIHNARLFETFKNELERRRAAEQEVELVFNTSLDFMVILELDGAIRRLSPGWVTRLGWLEEDLISQNISKLIHPDDQKPAYHKAIALGDHLDLLGLELRILSKDGQFRWFAWNAHRVVEGNRDLVIAIGRDITLQKEMEAKNRELEKAMQMEAVKVEFFANISHEFRTPLNIILSALQLIQQNIKNENANPYHNKALRHLGSIRQNSFRLLRLVNNLIDITRLDTGYFQITKRNHDIVRVVENITQSVAQYIEGKGLNLVFDTDVEEVIIACDFEIIERIMLNLLSNAVKFTEIGGCITVTIQNYVDRVRISVIDTGIGIPENKKEAIFERFIQGDKQFTRGHEGSGIGLSLVKSMVALHGGSIWVESSVNEGSQFILELPVQLLDDDQDCHRIPEPSHEEHFHKINVEFSDIYAINR